MSNKLADAVTPEMLISIEHIARRRGLTAEEYAYLSVLMVHNMWLDTEKGIAGADSLTQTLGAMETRALRSIK